MGLISTESMDLKPICPWCQAEVEVLEVKMWVTGLSPCGHWLSRGQEQVMLDELRHRQSLSDRDYTLPGFEDAERRLRP